MPKRRSLILLSYSRKQFLFCANVVADERQQSKKKKWLKNWTEATEKEPKETNWKL